MSIVIRPVSDLADFNTLETLQQRIWGMEPDGPWVPAHLLITVAKNGGLVLAAYAPDGEIVGYVFGFLGSTDNDRAARGAGPLLHCSHMMGVLPEYEGDGIGTALKWAQRDHLRKQRIQLATWTFDPLLGKNAHLNIGKLGTVVRHYHVNLYGEIREELNAGLPSDRFETEWWLDSKRVTHRTEGIDGPSYVWWFKSMVKPINATHPTSTNHRSPGEWRKTDAPRFLVEIPADFQTMRADDISLAQEWRFHSREVLTWALGEGGYMVGFFNSVIKDGERRSYYVLTTNDDWSIGVPDRASPESDLT